MKKRTITLISVIGIVAVALVILFTTGTLPKNDLAGTIVKTSKYRKQQTKVGDIILSPDVLKDTAQGKQLAFNLSQLSYITESIADQTNEIINRIGKTSMAAKDKNEITRPLSQYRDMIVTNMKLMRNSSENILTAINNNTTEMTEDIDKSFNDIGGFFNRYRTDNNAITNAIINIEKLVVKNSIGTQEGPSDVEIIRDKLYTVAYLNANFLQEKELKKELLIKILQKTEVSDTTGLTSEDKSIIIYNDEKKAFQAINANYFEEINAVKFNEMASSGSLPTINNALGSIIIIFCNQQEMNSLLSLESSALELQTEMQDAYAIRSMAIGSMEKYSGSYTMNVNDLKSILNQDELMMIASSPIMSLTKASAAKLASVLNNEELKSLDKYGSSSEALKVALGLSGVQAVNDLNLQIEASSLDVILAKNNNINNFINSCLVAEKLQYVAVNSLEVVTLTGTFDTQYGIYSQAGMDYLPSNLAVIKNLESQQMQYSGRNCLICYINLMPFN